MLPQYGRGQRARAGPLLPAAQIPPHGSYLNLETPSSRFVHLWACRLFQNSGRLSCQWDSAEKLVLPKSSPQPKTEEDQCRSTAGSLASPLGNQGVGFTHRWRDSAPTFPGAVGVASVTVLAVALPSSPAGLSAAPK